jgi:hypothetical protein
MSFRENLLKKIKIKQLTKQVLASMGPVDSGKRTDIDAVRELLGMSPYMPHSVRDLTLYMPPGDGDICPIIVLGNDLPMYQSSPDDIAMRRSPTVKEMISIRNAIKILNDSDVLISKGSDTVATVQKACLAELDLDFDQADLAAIAADGSSSLESGYQEGVIECLSLFAELLGFESAPKKLSQEHVYIIGEPQRIAGRMVRFGPLVLYAKIHNQLKWIDAAIGLTDPEKIEYLQNVAAGNTPASIEGAKVFQQLSQSVLIRPEAADQ